MKNRGVKVLFVFKDFDDQIQVESVWAEQEGGFYRIKNIPFFAPNISYNDLVSTEKDGNDLYFENLVEPSGHSTIQMIFFSEEVIDETTKQFKKLGCDWEGSHLKKYFSVDIPKSVSYPKIKSFLDEGMVKNLWDYKEACLSEEHATMV